MENFIKTISAFFESTGVAGFFRNGGYLNLIMILVALLLLFLAIRKKFAPYLLLPIAFGMLLVNLPGVGKEIFAKGASTYDAVSLSAKAGIDLASATTLLGPGGMKLQAGQMVSLAEIHTFLGDNPNIIDAVSIARINDGYNDDYTGMFGFLY